MKQMMRVLCIAMVAGLALAGTASANIVMSWAPWHVGEPGAAGDWLLFADIQESESIVGWGLDIYWNGPITAAVHAYGPAWDVSGVYAASPDPTDPDVDFNFADITAYPEVGGVWGAQVLLAALTFTNVTNPLAQVTVWAHDPLHVTGSQVPDLNEGFARNPPPTGVFVEWGAIPEPGTLALLGVGLLCVGRRRR